MTLFYNFYLKHDTESRQPLRNLSKQMLKAEEAGDRVALEPLLACEFKITRADGKTYNREQYLADVPAKKHRGRLAD